MTDASRFARLRSRWEERALRYGTRQAGVLYQGLSEDLNRHIHEFHAGAVRRLLARLPRGGSILDAGCGFGRIGRIVALERPDARLVGCDFALDYCRLYARGLRAEAVCCDLARLPLRAASFDALIAVTALMYLPPGIREGCVAHLLALLRPGGLALFVEPSQGVLRLISAVRPSSARATTGGAGFTLKAFRDLPRAAGCASLEHGGMPLFTALLPLIIALESFPRLQRRVLAAAGRMDGVLRPAWRFSLQRWLLVERPPSVPAC